MKQTTTEASSLDALIAQDRKDVAQCLDDTDWSAKDVGQSPIDTYAEGSFFDCFRPHDQIFSFFDTLASQNPSIMTRLANISTTYEGRGIHAYKIATPAKHEKTKKSLYVQSLIHAREWQAGASTHFTMASLVDGLRLKNDETVQLFDEFDWYFVPIVNVDGYKYSWEVDRYWRVNRHPSNGFDGVDLNRNFPPEEFFNLDPKDVSAETNPGPAPLSEPETNGTYAFVMSLPNLAGVVDVHAYGGMVLRPFSDEMSEPVEPYGSAMKRLGDAVRDVMSPKGEFQYVSQPSGKLYPAYGCFDDAFYRATNFTVPALTIEVEGNDFIAPQDKIQKVGKDVSHGLRRFAKEASTYHKFIEKLRTKHGAH